MAKNGWLVLDWRIWLWTDGIWVLMKVDLLTDGGGFGVCFVWLLSVYLIWRRCRVYMLLYAAQRIGGFTYAIIDS